MQYKINYTIKAEVYDKIKEEKIYFTQSEETFIDEEVGSIYDIYNMIGSGSIYEFLDHQIDLYAKENGNDLDDYRIDFFEVFTESTDYEIFFAHPENKNEFTLTPKLFVFIPRPEIEKLITPSLNGELLTNTSIKWTFDIPSEYLKSCGHYIYDEKDNLIVQLPVGVNHYIESSLKPLSNYTRKVKRYTANKDSLFSEPITVTTKIDDIESTVDDLRPFEKDWHNETDFETKTIDRLKAFQSGIGEGNDLKLLDIDANKTDLNLGVKYKFAGVKNSLSYKDKRIYVRINAVNNDAEVEHDARHSDGSVRQITKTGYVVNASVYKNLNGYFEESVTLGKKNKTVYDSETYKEIRTSINYHLTGTKIPALEPGVVAGMEKYSKAVFDSLNISFNVNGETNLDNFELYYVTDDDKKIALDIKNKNPDESFESFIKNKVIDGIIPIESEGNIFSEYNKMTKDDENFDGLYTYRTIEEFGKRFLMEYNKAELVEIGPWESPERNAEILSLDFETEDIEYKVLEPRQVSFDLKMNHVIKPLYISVYIDNFNFKFDSRPKKTISFKEGNKILKEDFSFNKTINPMNPILEKGFYYLNNLEHYKYNNHKLKLNRSVISFKERIVSSIITYKLIAAGEEYVYKTNVGNIVLFNGEEQSITNSKTINEIILEHIEEISNPTYDSIELIDVELSETIAHNGPLTLENSIIVSSSVEPLEFGYDNVIDVIDNSYTIESFDNIEQEKLIIIKGGVALKRVYNKEDESSLTFSFNKNGANKRSYQLPHIDIDHETFVLKLDGQVIENYNLFNNNITFSEKITTEQSIEVSYRIKNSYVIYEKNGKYEIKFHTDLPGDYKMYYEKYNTPKAIDTVSLNPLFNGITEGYLYIDDNQEDIKRFEIHINDMNVNYSNNEMTFGKIVAIDEFSNTCPNIKVYSDVEQGEIEYLNGDITNENGVVSFLYRPPSKACEDTIIVTHPDINEIKKVIINVQ